MQPSIANEMLNKITDPVERERYGNILNGQIVALVHCDSKACGGRVIADVMADGRCQEREPIVPSQSQIKRFVAMGKQVPHYVSGLEGDRTRLDGSHGFRCYCGNNSILHANEVGHISHNAPSKRDLEQIFGKMQRNPTEYPEVNGMISIDGFTIERVQV